jgi:hypothetical protein
LPTKDSKVVKWTHSDPKTEHSSSKISSPFVDGTEKAAPRKSAERPSQTKSVLGINTDFLGCTKYPRATLMLTTTKAAAPAGANGPGCPVRVSGWRAGYRRPQRIVEQEQVPQAQTPKETGHLAREARVYVRGRLPPNVEGRVHIIHTIPLEAEELLATL